MAAVQILNNSNTVLIDDEYSNLVLATKSWAPFAGNVATIDYAQGSGDLPLIAFRSSSPVALGSVTKPNAVTYRFTAYKALSDPAASVEYYIFHLPHALPSANGLVQLFNGAGRLVFDSNLKYFRLALLEHLTSMSTRSWTLPAGRAYAVAAPHPLFLSVNAPIGAQPPPNVPFANQTTFYGYSVNGNLIQGNSITINAGVSVCPGTNCGWSFFNSQGPMMVVDVTGM